MKHKRLRNYYLKLGILLFGISVTLLNCENDDEKFINNEPNSKIRFTYEYQTVETFGENSLLTERLAKIKSVENDFKNRNSSTQEYDFTVNTDFVKYIEATDGSHHSYTFFIERNEPNELTENLVLTLQPDGSYHTEIVTYYFPNFNDIGIARQVIDFDSSTVLDNLANRVCVGWMTCTRWEQQVCECGDEPRWVCAGGYTYDEVCTEGDDEPHFVSGDEVDGGSGGSGGSGNNNDSSGNNNQWGNSIWTTGNDGGGNSGNTSTNTCRNCNNTTTSSPLFSPIDVQLKHKLGIGNTIGGTDFDEQMIGDWIEDSNNFTEVFQLLSFLNSNTTILNNQEKRALVLKIITIFSNNASTQALQNIYEHKVFNSITGNILSVLNFNIFPEHRIALSDIDPDNVLDIGDWGLISAKTLQNYQLKFNYQLSTLLSPSELSSEDQTLIAKNAAFIAFLPKVKSLTTNNNWPQNQEQWRALSQILFQEHFLIEMGLSLIPGSGILDAVSGFSEQDYVAATLGIATVVVDFFGGTIVKAIGKIGKTAYKTFKIFKIVFRYLNKIADIITLGYKADLVNGIVKISNNFGTLIAEIQDNVIKFLTNSAKSIIKVADLKLLDIVSPTPNGFINQTKINNNALKIKPENSNYADDIADIMLNEDPLGKKTEDLIQDLLAQDGFNPPNFDVHIPPSNNGFDNVFIKKDNSGNITDIIINESKQVSNSGAISLSNGVVGTTGSTCSGCTQMSTDWIDDVLVSMNLQGGNLQTLANEIQDFIDAQNTITQLVSGVNKNTGELVIVNITGF